MASGATASDDERMAHRDPPSRTMRTGRATFGLLFLEIPSSAPKIVQQSTSEVPP
jgi:hypothetical protein